MSEIKKKKENVIIASLKNVVNYIIPIHDEIKNKKDNLELIPTKIKGLNSLIEIKNSYYLENGEYKRIFSFSDFFDDYLENNFFNDCLTANLKIRITFKYQVTDKLKSKRKLQSIINDLNKSTNGDFSENIMASITTDKIDKMHATVEEAKELINTNKLIDFMFFVTLTSSDIDQLNIETDILHNISENNGFTLTPIIYKQQDALKEIQSPDSFLNKLSPYKKKLLQSNVSSFMPIRTDIRGISNSNIWIGRTRESKQFLTAPFLTDANINTHTLILGSTGFGKSTLLKTIILQARLKGVCIVAVDPQGELKAMSDLFKGDLKKCGYSQSFKLLNGNLNEEDKEVYIKLLTSYFVKLNNEETLRSYYSACLYELLESKKPTIELFKKIVSKKDKENLLNNRLNDSLAIVFKGKLGQMLSGTQEIDITNSFTVFDFSELQSKDHNDEFKSMFLSLFTFAISKAMHEKNNKSLFVLDEAYQILDDKNSRDFVLKTVKKIRKMNSSVLISMQTLTDYGEDGKNLWSLCNYKFLFRHENTGYLASHLDLGEIETINNFDRGEYLFINQNKKIVGTSIDPDLTPRIREFITYNNKPLK